VKSRKKLAERLVAIAALRDKELTPETMELYWQSLKEHEDDVVFEALSEGVKNRWKWFPMPAEINEMVEEVEKKRRAIAETARHEKEMQEWRQLREPRNRKALPEPLRNIIKSVVGEGIKAE